MDITKVPYLLRILESSTSRKEAALLLARLNERDSLAASRIAQSFITHYNSLTQRVSSANEETYTELNRIKEALSDFLEDMVDALYRCEYRLAYMILRVNYQRCLGTSRYQERLRILQTSLEGCRDYRDCFRWLSDNRDVVQCDICDRWEYSSKLAETYDNNLICRTCVTNDYSWSDYYQRQVATNSSAWAIMPDQREVLIDTDDEDFEYNDGRDQYVHVDWRPEPPPVIGGYHNSKPLQHPQHDSWSVSKHRWFGVELEVELKNRDENREDKARLLNELINGGEIGKNVFFENDGSLSYGFEIITQPMSLPKQRSLWDWLKDRECTRNLLSHNTSSCGLHVHVNKDGLSQIQIAKIVTFVNDPRNADLIRAIARRYAEGYCKIKMKTLDNAAESSDRYEAVNITGRKTIEFRIFKGSLKYESVISAIEFCNALVEFSASESSGGAESLNTDNFLEFIQTHQVDETATLRPYLGAVLQSA